jgi:hypothetical protein
VYVSGGTGGSFVKSGGGTIDAANTAQYGRVAYVIGGRSRNATAGPRVDMNSRVNGRRGGWE